MLNLHMEQQYQTKWAQLLASIQQRLNQDTFNTWFKPIGFIGIKDDIINLSVPNSFFNEYLLEHHGKLLLSECNKHFGIDKIKIDWAGQKAEETEIIKTKNVFNTHLSN